MDYRIGRGKKLPILLTAATALTQHRHICHCQPACTQSCAADDEGYSTDTVQKGLPLSTSCTHSSTAVDSSDGIGTMQEEFAEELQEAQAQSTCTDKELAARTCLKHKLLYRMGSCYKASCGVSYGGVSGTACRFDSYLLRALLTVSTLSSRRLNMFAWADSCFALAGRGLMKKANWASGRICRSRVSKPSILAPNFASPVPCKKQHAGIQVTVTLRRYSKCRASLKTCTTQ